MNSSDHVICGGLTFEGTPVELREKVAFRDAQLPDALTRMKAMLGLREAVLVSTCNRVEYSFVNSTPSPRISRRCPFSCAACLASSISIPLPPVSSRWS
jgi:glutamyl-tRNA reductase